MAFQGFIKGVRYIPVPAPVFGELLQEIQDITELKIILRIIRLLHNKKGLERYVSVDELLADRVLSIGLGSMDLNNRKTNIIQSLESSTKRKILIKINRKDIGTSAYFLNTEFERQSMKKMPDLEHQSDFEPWETGEDRPNIYSLYEQNIGILTPIVAEKIGEAEQKYPVEWIEEAIAEAVSLNSRNWRYISRILERWEIEGKQNGESRKHSGKARYI
ncbi:MAG TPA: DnaD domain protein [SAR202 cluster bacterium]|jgi:DnaD/phage-associated family protein|nr:DnaD domain protein [SAR202 cluster bacterium]|tara:strand:- start:3796 stop:4449 length:654 start_codon:yes stop_codon:yes gene_type:complete